MNKKMYVSLIIVLMCFYGSFLGMADEEKKNSAVNTTDIENLKGWEGNTNTYYGLNAGFSIPTGSRNSMFGNNSGRALNLGNDNTFLGAYSGYSNTGGDRNAYIGNYAGYSNLNGDSNVAIGYVAGYYAITGGNNILIGDRAGYRSDAGNNNVSIGSFSGYYNNGSYNTFLGYGSGYNTTSGNDNVNLGYFAGFSNRTGLNNVIVGNQAGFSNELGSRNVFLGYKAGFNEIGSDKLYIANSDTINPLIYGDFSTQILEINGKLGIGITPTYPIHTGSGAYCSVGGVWTNASSRALKENIVNLDSNEAIDTLNNLNPVKYNYKVDKSDKHVGFIAEDVPELVATGDRKGLSAMDVTAVLTKVLQEQQKIVREQQEIIKDLQERLERLEKNKK